MEELRVIFTLCGEFAKGTPYPLIYLYYALRTSLPK